MPFYDLRCKNCDIEFNVMASMSDRAEGRIACPECGSRDVDAVFKAANFLVKASAPNCPNSHVCGTG